MAAVMNERADARLVRRCAGIATAVSIFAMAAGLAVLTGWTLNIVTLITWGAATPMAPNSAAACVFAGLSLWLLRSSDNPGLSSVRLATARGASVACGLIGALSLAQFFSHLDLGSDRLLLLTAPTLAKAGLRIFTSPLGAVMYVLLSLSLLTIDRRTLRLGWPAQFLALAAMMTAAFGSIGILIVPGASPIALALPTALIGLSLPIGIVCARSPWAIGGLLTSDTREARLLRKTVPAALFALSLVGLLLSRPLLTGNHISAAAATVLALFCTVLLAGFIAWIASIVDHDEIERRKLEEAQLLSSGHLERLLNRMEEPAEDAPLRRKVTFALAFAILLTGLLGYLSWRDAQQATETAEWVAQTHEVMTDLESALRHSLDVETGGRGFAETGSAVFLEPYDAGRPAVVQDVHALRLLVVNPDQLRRLNVLEEQTNDQVRDVEAIVATRQNRGKIPAVALFEHGKRDMDAVRVTVAQMEVAERVLLALRTQRARAAQHSSSVVITLGSLLGVLFLTVAGVTVSREIGVSARARGQVKALNADLEQRVEQRTAALAAEAAARQESEGRLAAVIKSAMDSIITLDHEQRIVLFSQAAEKLFQCASSEAAGRPITSFIPHLDRLNADGFSNQVIGLQDALMAVRADGEEFQIEASISQYEIAERRMFTIILRDITERKHAEEMRERLSLIVDSSDDAIISKTLDGTIAAWNRGAEKVFGYPAAEMVGKTMLMLLPPERIGEEASILSRIRLGESVEHFETVRVRKDGTAIDVSVTISPIRNGNGVVVGASKIARDITQRKQAEDALREKERRLSESQRIAHIGNWAYDLKDAAEKLVWSDELYHLYGVSSETFVPTMESLLNLIVHEDRPLIRNWMTACAAGEKPAEMDFHLTLPDGAVRVFSRRGELQYDADNKPRRLVGTSQDITERRLAEAALRESEERLLAMANGIPQLAWIAGSEGSIYWYNQRWYEFTGTTLEQMQGWGWQSVHHPNFLPEVLARWTSAIAEGKPLEMEFPLRGADGLFRAFLTRVMPLKDSEGRVVRWFGTNTDISELKQTQERLASQAEELRGSRQALERQAFILQTVLDSMVEGLVAADQQGNFILWNPAAEKIMGLGPTKLATEDWSAHYGLYLPDTVTPIPSGETPMERTLRGEVVSTEIFLRQAGVNPGLWLETNGSPLIDKDGTLRGGVLAFRDITRRKTDELVIRKLNEELEEKIAKRTEQLEASNRELEAFSYSVSHDLRTPLRHIAGFSRILVKEFGPAMPVEAQEHLQRIEDAVSRMAQLIDALLKLAVLRRQPLRLRRSELNPIVEEVVSMLQPECEGRDVEWRVAKLPALDCDPVLMAQVFQNLLGNAMKYSRDRAKALIEVDSIQQPGKPAVIFVRDNGAGFNLKYAEKLFGVFQRFHTTSEFEGTGVGLATVHRIIQKHGGMIWAEAEPEHGATFYFALQTTDRIDMTPNVKAAS
jgi:PAS domain S-box-containing protein